MKRHTLAAGSLSLLSILLPRHRLDMWRLLRNQGFNRCVFYVSGSPEPRCHRPLAMTLMLIKAAFETPGALTPTWQTGVLTFSEKLQVYHKMKGDKLHFLHLQKHLMESEILSSQWGNNNTVHTLNVCIIMMSILHHAMVTKVMLRCNYWAF